MKKIVQIYYGEGKGKTTAAVGQSIHSASLGYEVIMIQFLKGKDADECCILNKLEPNIKLFRFEKAHDEFLNLSQEEQEDEKKNILNGFNFAKKVIDTGECDTLILDEILGLVDLGIISVEDIIKLIEWREDYFKLVLTGRNMPKELFDYAHLISEIKAIKQ